MLPKSQWLCFCNCGNDGFVTSYDRLVSGTTKSCGCLRKETVHSNRTQFKSDDLSGRKFHRLTALHIAPSKRSAHTNWLCRCICGNEKITSSAKLKSGSVKSCGCLQKEITAARSTRHNKSNTPEIGMFYGARKRAKDQGLPFDIELDDITIPERCPLLNIPLIVGKGRWTANSPTLDRIEPVLGYTKKNVQVISHRANAIKRDASFSEFRTILENWDNLRQGIIV